MTHLLIGAVLVLVAVGLIFIGRPNKAGQHPPFLRFDASLVLYPPVILVFVAMGLAEVITGLVSL